MSTPSESTISVSRVMGPGGENSQRNVAVPGWLKHQAVWATRKSSLPMNGGLANAPEAKAKEPGPTGTPRYVQPFGPLQISFCNWASKIVLSRVTVLVSTQLVASEDTLMFCTRW